MVFRFKVYVQEVLSCIASVLLAMKIGQDFMALHLFLSQRAQRALTKQEVQIIKSNILNLNYF